MSRKKVLLISGSIIGVLIIIGGSVWGGETFFSSDSTSEANVENNTVEENGWQTYTSSSVGFQISHPVEAEISKPDSKTRKFQVVDGDSKFVLIVKADKKAQNYTSVTNYGRALQKESAQEISQEGRIVSFENIQGFEYFADSNEEQIRVDYAFLPENTSRGYTVSVDMSTPGASLSSSIKQRYKNIADRMLNTLSFQ